MHCVQQYMSLVYLKLAYKKSHKTT